MNVFLRNLCLLENAEAIDSARYSMIIEVEAHTRKGLCILFRPHQHFVGHG